jgi:hypothetical protein
MPYFERGDKDAYLYIANNIELAAVAKSIKELVEEKFISYNKQRTPCFFRAECPCNKGPGCERVEPCPCFKP